MRWAVIAGVLAACSFHDASPDGGGILPDVPPSGAACVGPLGNFQICVPATHPNTIALAGNVDTDSDPRCSTVSISGGWTMAPSPGQPPSCILVADAISVGDVQVSGGMHALVVIGIESVAITGQVDLSSHRTGSVRGPGSTLAIPCTPGLTPANGGGGAGASFMTNGGDGGKGSAGNSRAGLPAPHDGSGPAYLRAGCAGQSGDPSEAGGLGGGGVYIATNGPLGFAANTSIDASGAAGSAGSGGGQGGGGAGSGGVILLYAQAITIPSSVAIIANGGGGATGTNAVAGAAGGESQPAMACVAAPGGTAASAASGGAGYACGVDATSGANPAVGGGGGGGGGGGFIYANKSLAGAMVTPPASTIAP